VNGEMLNSSYVPTAATFNFIAMSDDGVIQLVIPKTYSNSGIYSIEYTGTASLKGINYPLLFRYQVFG